jgi:AP endonuclease-1
MKRTAKTVVKVKENEIVKRKKLIKQDISVKPTKKTKTKKIEVNEECSCEEKTPKLTKKSSFPLLIDHENKKYRQEGNPWIGAHVSAAGGVDNAVVNATRIKANSFALFLKNQRQWNIPTLEQSTIDKFRKLCVEHGFEGKHILPHGSYLVNLGNSDKEKREKGLNLLIEDLERCEKLGISLYTFHPGSTNGECSVEESIRHISDSINIAHDKTNQVIITIENMAGQGNVVGSKFEELGKIIELVKNKDRIGVCFDTCHAFAAGYDLRTKESFNKVFDKFDEVIGLKYLKGIHLNDSKGDLGDCKDRHECLGKGKIGMDCFKILVNDKRFHNIPIILETPVENIYEDEIKSLYTFYSPK